MIYGKQVCRVRCVENDVFLTVHDVTPCVIKQGDRLILLTRAELRELATDALAALDDLENGRLA